LSQGKRDRGLTAIYVEFSAGVEQMKIDRSFAEPQNEGGFPTGFAKGHPFEAFEFSF
jgi:hypothetical protein